MKICTIAMILLIGSRATAQVTGKFLEEVVGGDEAKKIYSSGSTLIKADQANVSDIASKRLKENPKESSVYVLAQINTATIRDGKTAECMEFRGFDRDPSRSPPSTFSCAVKTKLAK